MSVKSKGINIEKIIKELDKADVDDQVKALESIKEHINAKITEREQDLEDDKKRLSSYKERIK